MTQEEIDTFKIKEKLDAAEKELQNIELTSDKSRRVRWRELKKIIKYYKSITYGVFCGFSHHPDQWKRHTNFFVLLQYNTLIFNALQQ